MKTIMMMMMMMMGRIYCTLQLCNLGVGVSTAGENLEGWDGIWFWTWNYIYESCFFLGISIESYFRPKSLHAYKLQGEEN